MDFNAVRSIPLPFHLDVPNLETLTLGHNKLRHVQGKHLPRNLTYISFEGNLIRTITPEALAGLDRLQSVKFSNNQISFIAAKTFSLPFLKVVLISGNRISVIEKNSFPNSLKIIRLKDNKLTDFSALNACEHLQDAILDDQHRDKSPQDIPFLPRLDWLSLSNINGNSAVASIQKKAPRLVSLTLINGNIPHLHLTDSSMLLQLILTSNSIKTVGNMSKIPRLIILSMKGNLLQGIPDISGLHTLEELNLSFNKIRTKTIPKNLHLKLSHLQIHQGESRAYPDPPNKTETIALVCVAKAHGDAVEIDFSIHLAWDTGSSAEAWNMSCSYQVRNASHGHNCQ
nr:leucine-rich repeat and death domain-containing protein 1-like [Lytechinus pictus]